MPQLRDREIQCSCPGVELAVPVPGAAQGVGFRAHQGVDDMASGSRSTSGVVVVRRSATTCGQSTLWAVVVVSIPQLRVTLDGLAKNHAMTVKHSATNAEHPGQTPTRTTLLSTTAGFTAHPHGQRSAELRGGDRPWGAPWHPGHGRVTIASAPHPLSASHRKNPRKCGK